MVEGGAEGEAQYLDRLLTATTRAECLDELEKVSGASRSPPPGALSAVLRAMAGADADHVEFRRMGTLVVRLSFAGDGHPGTVIGTACADGQLAALYAAETVATRCLLGGAATELTADAVISYVCLHAWSVPACIGGLDEQFEAASRLKMVPHIMQYWRTTEPLCVARFSGDPAVPLQVATLILEMLHEPPGERLPEELRPAAALALFMCHGVGAPPPAHYAAVAQSVVAGGIIELIVSEIEATRNADRDWMSIRDGLHTSTPGMLMWTTMAGVMPAFLKTQSMEDVQALRKRCVSSGFFQLALDAMSHFASRGTEAVSDGNHIALYFLLKVPNFCRAEPGCEEQIRARAPAIAFCMDNNLPAIRTMHGTSAQAACQLAANIFGRDDDSELVFSTEHINELMGFWSAIVNASGPHKMFPPSAEYLSAHTMCKSDDNKRKLLAHPDFLPMLISGLLLAEDHPRLPLAEGIRHWCQAMHAECFMQLAVFAPGKAALLQSPEAIVALETLAEVGFTVEAKDFAHGALVALKDAEQSRSGGFGSDDQEEHIMLSYQWDVQPIIVRLNTSLQQRGYKTWLDLECMKGSVMDAMSDAVEGAAVMLYAVSLAYKESANCRLEAQYGMQSDCDMIPLMVENNYKAKGWLGLLLGARLWYAFWEADQDDNDSFEARVNPLVAEIGTRGKVVSDPSRPKPTNPARTVAAPPAQSSAADASSSARDQAKTAQQNRAQALSGAADLHADVATPQPPPAVAAGATFAELLSIFREEQSLIETRLANQKTEAIQAQRRVNDEQIDALQRRLHTLLDAGILGNQIFYVCEDIIADNVEAMATGSAATDELVRMVALSERLRADASLARQLLRKFPSRTTGTPPVATAATAANHEATAQAHVGGL